MAVTVQAFKWHNAVDPELAADYDRFFTDHVGANLWSGDPEDWERIKEVANCYAFTDYPYK